MNILRKKEPVSKIQGFSIIEWIRCKKLYAEMKESNLPDHKNFGSAGGGIHSWSLFKTSDQHIYLIEFKNYGKSLSRYEKLNDDFEKEISR